MHFSHKIKLTALNFFTLGLNKANKFIAFQSIKFLFSSVQLKAEAEKQQMKNYYLEQEIIHKVINLL